MNRAQPARVPSVFSGRALSRGERAIIAVTFGVAAGIAAWLAFSLMPAMQGRDFTYPLRGARALIAHQDPYRVIVPSGPAPFDMFFMYPLTAAIAALPLAMFATPVAAAVFVALSVTTMAFLLLRRGLGAAWVFLSVPFAMATVLAQWSPLLIAGTLATPLAWALVCKPTIGAALFAYRPNRSTAAICAFFLLASFALNPHWVGEWFAAARNVTGHGAPVTHAFGFLPLLALARWRDPRARLVAAMALVPQNLDFYDQLPLFLVAQTGPETFALTALSWLAWGGTKLQCADSHFCGQQAAPWIIGLLYVPATILVLRNGGTARTDDESRSFHRSPPETRDANQCP